MKRRGLAVVLAVVMTAFIFTGCGGNAVSNNQRQAKEQTKKETTTESSKKEETPASSSKVEQPASLAVTEEKKTYDNFSLKPSPDKYTFYIQDYVGKNVRSIGYISLGGDCRDRYGDATVLLNLVADDGSYIDVQDETILQQYMVTGQNVAPNSEMKLTYDVDSNGKEYSNLIDTQTYDAITLTVKPVTDGPVVSKKES